MEILDNTFIHIPIPFKKGDIVTIDDEIPCVLVNMVHWENNYQNYLSDERFSASDNVGDCYMLTEGSELIGRHGGPFLTHRLRYYKGSKLKGQQQFLKYLSHYLKEEVNVGWLISAWQRFYSQAQLKKANSNFCSLNRLMGGE